MAAGTLHFVVPAYYRAIVPSYLPAPATLVAVTGAAEIAGGQCSWCKDKWGVSWQITPCVLTDALARGGDAA